MTPAGDTGLLFAQDHVATSALHNQVLNLFISDFKAYPFSFVLTSFACVVVQSPSHV